MGTSGPREVGVGRPTILAQQIVCSQSPPGGIRVLSPHPTPRLEGQPPKPRINRGDPHPNTLSHRGDHQPLPHGRNIPPPSPSEGPKRLCCAIEGTPVLCPLVGSNPMGKTTPISDPFPLQGTSVSRSQPRNPQPQSVFGLAPHARHLRGLRARVAVTAPQLAALRVPELRGEGVADRWRGRGGWRLQQQQEERQQRHRSHSRAGRERRGTPAPASSEDAAAAAGTGSLTSPERGSLGRRGRRMRRKGGAAALRHCLDAGRWIAAPAVSYLGSSLTPPLYPLARG